MQKINIDVICVGKIKDKNLSKLIDDYILRLSKYAKVNIIELKDESYDNINQTIEVEGEKILAKIDERSFVIGLDIKANQITSEELACKINQISLNYPKICFIIGGSWGLSDKVKNRCDLALSFSKLTFPHQLFRLMLIEQIYRAMSILNHSPYHK